MTNSNFLNLNGKDLIKGFIVAFLGALLSIVYNYIEAGTLVFTWAFFKPVLLTSLGAGIAYLLKNFFTNSEQNFLNKE